MATTFDPVLLDTWYSAIAEGGPEFATAIIDAGEGGNISFRNSNREDYISRYQIDFSEVSSPRRKALRQFSILREGMARGFLFLPPDDNQLERERVGWLNPDSGEVELLEQTNGDIYEFYLIKYYSDPFNNYTRRIVKPSPYEDVLIEVFGFGAEDSEPIGIDTIPANTAIVGGIIQEQIENSIDILFGEYSYTFNFFTGKLTFENPLIEGFVVKVSCQYHLPVAFEDDWQRFKVDEGGISSFAVRLRELLPIDLGIV